MDVTGNHTYDRLLSGEGEMKALMRAKNWDNIVGPPATWPANLRSVLNIVLSSKFPMFLWWGNDLIQFYNDAYREILGNNGKHPQALGQKGADCWQEIWPVIKPLIDDVMTTGNAIWQEDQLIPIYRNNKLDDVYWTFSYSPVYSEETDGVAGVLVVCTETTKNNLAVKKMLENDLNFRNMIIASPVPTAVFKGPDFVVELANTEALKLWGRDETVIGLPIAEAMPELISQQYIDLLHNVYTTGKRYEGKENKVVIKYKNKELIKYVDFIYEPQYDNNRNIIGIITIGYDITEQVLLRHSISDAEERARIAVESALLGTFDIDFLHNTSVVSERLSQIFGFPDTNVSIQQFFDRIHPDDVHFRTDAGIASLKTGDISYKVRIILPDQTIRWVHIQCSVYFNEKKEPVRSIGTVRDITAEKHLVHSLQHSEEKFRNSIIQAPVGMAILHIKGRLVDVVNNTLLQIIDKKQQDVVGFSLYEMVPETEAYFEPVINEIIRTGKPYFDSNYNVPVRRYGRVETGHFNLALQPVYDTDTVVSGIIMVVNDYTTQVKAQQRLLEYETEFRNMVMASPIAMAVFRGKDMVIEIANTAMMKLWQREGEDVRGQRHHQLMPELQQQKFAALMDTVFNTGLPYEESESLAYINRAGKPVKYYFNYLYSPLFASDGKTVNGLMATTIDITETVENKKKIEEKEQQYQQLIYGLPTAIYTCDNDGYIILYNKAAVELWGREPVLGKDRWCGSSGIFSAQGAAIPLDESPMAEAIKNHIFKNTEIIVEREDGTRRNVIPHPQAIKNTAGEITGTVNMLVDITVHKNSEKELRESEDRLHLATEGTRLATWDLNIQTREIFHSAMLSVNFGHTEHDRLTFDEFRSHIHPEDRKNIVEKAFAEALKTGFYHYEARVIWPDKSIHWVRTQGKVIFDRQQVPQRMLGTLMDITEQKLSKDKLEESEQRFRTIADTAPVFIWLAGLDKGRYFFNKAWLVFTGHTLEQEAGHGWVNGLHPDDAKLVLDVYHTNFEKQQAFYMEYRLRRYDGEYRWLSVNGIPRFTAEGHFEGFIGACMDITDRIIFEEKLKQSESRLRIAAFSSELGTWNYDVVNDVLSWDNSTKDLLGVAADTPVTLELFFQRLHPEDRGKVKAQMARAIDPGIAEPLDTEYRVLGTSVNGTSRWIHAKGKALFNEDNTAYVFSGTVLDITEKKVALDELQESEQKFRLLADSMPQFIWTCDEKGAFNYSNKTMQVYAGSCADTISKEGWKLLLHPGDVEENTRQWKQALNTGQNFLTEHRFRRHDGEYRWQLSRAIPQKDAAGNIQMWVGTSTDIDELKKHDQQKDDFIKMASHELKTPVTTIKGYVQLLLQMHRHGQDPFLANSLQTIDKQIAKLTKLITDLLDVTKIETGSLDFNKEVFSIVNVVEEITGEISTTVNSHHITVNSHANPLVFADKDRIAQVIINLLTNAIKYSPKSDAIIVDIFSGDNTVVIAVKDYGIGIAKEDYTKIFERFYRVAGKDEKTFPGFGIGLFIVNEIITLHNGKIWVESDKEKGTTFYFSLPTHA